MGNYCWDKCIGLLDSVGNAYPAAGPEMMPFAEPYPNWERLETELSRQQTGPTVNAEPAMQSAPQQEAQMYGSSIDVFT